MYMQQNNLVTKFESFDMNRWKTDGYDICYDGIKEKFIQNAMLLAMLKTNCPKNPSRSNYQQIMGYRNKFERSQYIEA